MGLVAIAACFVIAVVLVLSGSGGGERLASGERWASAAITSLTKLPAPVCTGFCLPKPGAEESSVRSCVYHRGTRAPN